MSREVFLTMIEGNTPCVVRIEGLEILFLCGTAGLKAAEENSANRAIAAAETAIRGLASSWSQPKKETERFLLLLSAASIRDQTDRLKSTPGSVSAVQPCRSPERSSWREGEVMVGKKIMAESAGESSLFLPPPPFDIQ